MWKLKRPGSRLSSSPVVLLIVFVILAIIPSLLKNPYQLRVLTIIAIFIAFTYAANIIFGESRQLFLCMSAISGIAAYTSAILSIELGLNPWLTILIGIAFSTAVGSLLSYVSVSRGLGVIFVAIVTLAFTLIFENTILGLRSITMGETGLVVPTLWWPLEGLFGRRLASYYVILAYSAIVALIYFMLIHSKFGMALKAIRSDNVSAEVIGIDVTKHQVMAVALGSSILGMGGSLYAYYQGMASPGVFSPLMDITIFLMLILGGFGAPIGPIVGAVFIILIQELTRGLGQLTMTFFGGLLVVLILIFREGIASIFDKVATYVYYSKRS